MTSSFRLSALALGLLLAGCTVGPDHVRSQIATGGQFLRAETTTAVTPAASAASEAAFWQRFDDPLLTGLVEDALRANHDLRIGLARLDQARALSRQSRFDLFPTVTAEAGASESRASACLGGEASATPDCSGGKGCGGGGTRVSGRNASKNAASPVAPISAASSPSRCETSTG